MIIVTGAAGFIGSSLLAGLNLAGYKDIVLVDDFSIHELTAVATLMHLAFFLLVKTRL